jgi:hypothetical protein
MAWRTPVYLEGAFRRSLRRVGAKLRGADGSELKLYGTWVQYPVAQPNCRRPCSTGGGMGMDATQCFERLGLSKFS